MADIKTLAVVPLEPTEAMLRAALQTIENRKKWGTKGHTVGQMLTEEWIAMIHAAPKSTLAEAHQAEVARLTRENEGLAKALKPFIGATLTVHGHIVGLMREDFDNARAALAGASGADEGERT